MVKITKISVQKRNKSRYNLFLDRGQGEEYAFSVDEDLLIKHGLQKGLELDEKDLLKLVDEDEQKKAYYLSINYLSFRMRSIEEMRSYLIKKEKEEHHIAIVIQQLIDEGLLDDEEFATAYVRTKKATSMRGPFRLKQELNEKGVKPSIIEKVLELYQDNEQIEQLITWLEKQKQRNQKQSDQSFSDKLTNQLQRRGYSHTVIKEAIDHVDLTKGNDEEWEAIRHQGEKIVRKYKGKYKDWEYKQRVKQALYRKGFSMELIDQFLAQPEQENEPL